MSFSDQKLKTVSQDIYKVDLKLHRKHLPKSGQIYHNYYVIQAEDTKKDKENGSQGMAVAPLDKNGKPDYSQIIIAFAGTGDAKKGADNYAPGNKGLVAMASTDKVIKKIEQFAIQVTFAQAGLDKINSKKTTHKKIKQTNTATGMA